MNFKYIENVPDIMRKEDIEILFENSLDSFNESAIDSEEFLNILYELTIRITNIYETPNHQLKQRIDEKVSSLWCTDDLELVDTITSLAINLGLTTCYSLIKESAKHETEIEPKIFKVICQTIAEGGEDVSNPYAELEHQFPKH